ncbi:MAG TPA: efflux RND transporter periplasmic adaptor subunit [Candidatus Saccharimonadales bacterium]|jgi:cobalt-zinc-cadmium efflux system membrane fusion protein|nr:efflux RND transporter periplasmic adaptor subunit [Candidatus Saccharimonadales bacterium]
MKCLKFEIFILSLSLGLLLAGCSGAKADPKAEAPPSVQVRSEQDFNAIEVAHPEQFPLATAVAHDSRSQLTVTGTVAPDISRSVPVISIATGRVVEIHARLGDIVKKGQVLLRVQSADMSAAFSDYRKAVADEHLTRTQLERADLLYGKGAISLNDLQVAQDTDAKAKVDIENTAERIRVLGGSLDHPAAVLEIRAPVSGTVTDQQVTNAAGVAGLGSPNPFTISDLSYVWVLCDVYENDLSSVHVGETAEIHLNAYPNQPLTGRISNVLPVLDPVLRTAKVRIEVRNPGLMRVGMFVTATFHGQKKESHAVVPATAILHLHDRNWVYFPAGDKKFRRAEVTLGQTVAGNMQEILSGMQPGQQVVQNALVFQSTVEQ